MAAAGRLIAWRSMLLPLQLLLFPAVAPALSALLRYTDGPHVPISAAAHSSSQVVHVDCNSQVELGDGSADAPFNSLQVAVDSAAANATVELAEGVCYLPVPLKLGARHSSSVLRGTSPRSVLSGGKPVKGWKPSKSWPGGPPEGSVFEADISAWPAEIKTLRHGDSVVPRARWPPLTDGGLSTPNWMYAMPWSTHPPRTSRGRAIHGLGIDARKLPAAGKNISELVGGYAHILGCVEKDVNSQMTKILSVSEAGSSSEPLAHVAFRGSFTTNQRYFLENVRWALAENSFFVDEAAGTLYFWPKPATAKRSDGGGNVGAAPIGVVAPTLDRLIDLEHVSGHTIESVTFTDTTYYSDGYWDGPAQQPNDAAVRINYCSAVTVEGCNFLASLSGYGVAIGNASTDTTVRGSLFDGVGQGGVILYGFDRSPVPGTPGRAPGNNTQPRRALITQNVMRNIGTILVHVAGVGLRSASECVVSHNRITRGPRYGLQADSFYTGEGGAATSLVSRGNIFEYNILSDLCRLTTDGGAIEMIGSGDPNAIAGYPWWNNNTIRYNNISDTVGSSSSDGKTVCVHGKGGSGCRGLVWGVYLDGGEAGITIHGNVIGATLHGAVFDNAGGNNTQTNNIFVAGPDSSIVMDFGAPGTGAPRAIAGNTLHRNIFYFWGQRGAAPRSMLGSQVGWSADFLKPNGSDSNLFFSPDTDAGTAPIFPGGRNFGQWTGQNSSGGGGPVTCHTPGSKGTMVVDGDCSWGWDHNETSQLYTARPPHGAAENDTWEISLDCEGNWANCDEGSPSTRICIVAYDGDWAPIVPGKNPGQVQNSAWNFSARTGELVNEPNGKCVEVCSRGGAVGGCDGAAGSIVQLRACTGEPKQQWRYNSSDGTFQSKLGTAAKPLCLGPPPRAAADTFDGHSIVADPGFEKDPMVSGSFALRPDSPAITKLGFVPIPPITAPETVCGGVEGVEAPSCLSLVV